MSASPNNVSKPAVAAASTTNDVIRAMANDQGLRTAVLGAFTTLAGKSFVGSRTVWATVLTPIVTALVTHFGLGLDEATCAEIATGLTTLVAVAMRLVTSAPITSVLPSTTGTPS